MKNGKLLAKILLSGDDHLKSKNHGQHIDYASESFHYFKSLGDFCEENNVTHWIGLGDLTYGRFNSLEYRDQVEEEFQRQNRILNGNRWIIKGNHDSASYGMTEYEYFLKKGYFKGSQILQIGNLNLSMVDFGKYNETDVLIEDDPNKKNIILTHGYFAFKGGKYNFGEPVILNDMHNWSGAELIICGHIHTKAVLNGVINDATGTGHATTVIYLPCLSRPAYMQAGNPEVGEVMLINVYEHLIECNIVELKLLPLEESFNLEKIKEEQAKKEAAIGKRVNIKDIVEELSAFKDGNLFSQNPEDEIMANKEIPLAVKNKACEYLKLAVDSMD